MRLISTLLLALCMGIVCRPADAHSSSDRPPTKRAGHTVVAEDGLHRRLAHVNAEMDRRLLAMLRPATIACIDIEGWWTVAEECETVFEVDVEASPAAFR